MSYDFDLLALSFDKDICSRIDSSELSKRILKLKPKITQTRNRTVEQPVKMKFKVIPQLKLAVKVIKKRLDSDQDRPVSRPSSRFGIEMPEYSPISYYKSIQSRAGCRFSNAPRLEDRITHQMSSVIVQKKKEGSKDFEKDNKKAVEDISKFQLNASEKRKKHNKSIYRKLNEIRVQKFNESEWKKKTYLEKLENENWKLKNFEEIRKSKMIWGEVFIIISTAFILDCKVDIMKKVRRNARKYSRLLVVVSRVIGIFRISLKRFRKSLIDESIRVLAEPLSCFLLNECKSQKKIIQNCLFYFFNGRRLFLLLLQWKNFIRKIQEAYRRYCVVKEARVLVFFKIVDEYEEAQKTEVKKQTRAIIKSDLKNNIVSYLNKVLYEQVKSEKKESQILCLFSNRNLFLNSISSFKRRSTLRKQITISY